jgi:L,D-peptidoglycan transpeptidase YkuD (ErfK/YbiS/YcfS/YnhG family)
MDLLVDRNAARWGALAMRCALGRGGISGRKREGDGATPAGAFPMRRLLYRPDRIAKPATALPLAPLAEHDGWCDAPGDPAYNRMVTLPYGAGAEHLWRGDALYDLIVPLGYNDDPVESGRGSAIFLHIARPDYGPTEGCVALSRDDLLAVLREADRNSRVVIAL